MAIKAVATIKEFEAESDFTFRVRMRIFAQDSNGEVLSSGEDVLSDTYFAPDVSVGAIKVDIFRFVRDYILTAWGVTIGLDDTIRIINPYTATDLAVALSYRFSAFWKLDEDTAATRMDSIGSNHLTDVGGVLLAEGRVGLWTGLPDSVGGAAQFDGAAYLTVDDSPDLVSGVIDFSFHCWVRADTSATARPIVSSRNRTLDRPVWEVWRLASGQIEIRAHNGATLDTYTTTFYIVDSVWAMLRLMYSASLGKFIVQVNAAQSTVHTHAPLTDSNRFSLGGDGAAAPAYFDGRIDACGYAPVLLNSNFEPELAILWNYGRGQEQPFEEITVPGPPTGTGYVYVSDGVQASGAAGVTVADGSITTAKIADLNITTAKIVDAAVTYQKNQNVSADKVLGRTAGTGVIEEITCTAVGRSLLWNDTVADVRSTLGLGGLALLGIVTSTELDSAAVTWAAIANDAVTYDKMQDISATSRVLGRITAGAGDPEELTFAQVQNTAYCRLAADDARSVTAKNNITGMSFVLAASTNYSIEFKLHTTANAVTVGCQFALTFGGTITNARFTGQFPGAATTLLWFTGTGASPILFDPLASQGNVPGLVTITGTIEVGASGGTLQLQHGSETATLTTVLRGSWGMCAKH